MSYEVLAVALPPDLRFAAAGPLGQPGVPFDVGGSEVRARGEIPEDVEVARHLRYADRGSVLIVDAEPVKDARLWFGDAIDRGVGASPPALTAAVLTLAAVDDAFRTAGLWRGNIYLAGVDALRAAQQIAGLATDSHAGRAESLNTLRELQSLELVYLFPVAPKFRRGVYDGEIQFRLNGWGRALANRLTLCASWSQRARGAGEAVQRHVVAERAQYAEFLSDLDLVKQEYAGDRLEDSRRMPIPVLV